MDFNKANNTKSYRRLWCWREVRQQTALAWSLIKERESYNGHTVQLHDYILDTISQLVAKQLMNESVRREVNS